MDEQKLLEKLRKKKRGALEIAINQYTPYVNAVVYNIIGQTMTREDMEEVVSSVFIALWLHCAELDASKGTIRSYLGAVARNNAKNKLRELKPCQPLEEFVWAESGKPHEEIERQEQASTLWNMIHTLGEPDSEIFLRYYFYEEKIGNIAKHIGLQPATVKTKLARGRQKLKKMIERNEVL